MDRKGVGSREEDVERKGTGGEGMEEEKGRGQAGKGGMEVGKGRERGYCTG
jgi:hypothetical protein